jgi:hypothetical protein
MLLAVAAEFRPVDAAEVSYRLDEYARVMFDAAAARDGGAASHRLAALLTDDLRFRTDESSIEGLWPLALAVLAAEIGRRAGIAVGVCSTPTGWYAGIGERERLWLIDPALDPGPNPVRTGAPPLRPRGCVRRADRRVRAADPRRRGRLPGSATALPAAHRASRLRPADVNCGWVGER